MLKSCYRQYQQYSKVRTMLKNNLISLLDTAFPDANRLFTSPPRADGSEKWVDFVAAFWHCECVCGCLRRPLPPSTRNGAKSTATISAKIRRWTFTLPPVDTSVSCQNGYRKTFGRTGHFPTPGNFRRVSCS